MTLKAHDQKLGQIYLPDTACVKLEGTRLMKHAIYLLVTFMLFACSQDQPAETIALPIPKPETTIATSEHNPSVSVAANEQQTSAMILENFKQDIEMCELLIEHISQDRTFIESFRPWDSRRDKHYVDFLNDASFANTPATQYIIHYHNYFDVDQDYHHAPWVIARIDDIYCALTHDRLHEIESLGESPEAWQIREFFLNGALLNLAPPSMDMVDGFLEFYTLEAMINEAQVLYTGTQRHMFFAWIEQAIQHIEQSRAEISPESGRLPVDEQHKEIDDQIAFLRSILAQR